MSEIERYFDAEIQEYIDQLDLLIKKRMSALMSREDKGSMQHIMDTVLNNLKDEMARVYAIHSKFRVSLPQVNVRDLH